VGIAHRPLGSIAWGADWLAGCDRPNKSEPYGSQPTTTPSTTNTVANPTPTTTMPHDQNQNQNRGTQTTFTDGQILGMMDVANSGEVEQGHEAESKAKSAKVKSFAKHMIDDHTSA